MDQTSAPAAPSAANSSASALSKLPDVMGQVRGAVDDGKARITASLDGFGKAAHDIADKLQASGVGPVAKYARQGAEMVTAWSKSINEKSLEDLVDDTRNFVRQKPAAAVGISLVAGFVVSRLFKAGAFAAPVR